jgi:hypothetical protein
MLYSLGSKNIIIIIIIKTAKVVVLHKPGKTIAQQQTAGAYRPISLLNSLGKVLETVISKHITAAAES